MNNYIQDTTRLFGEIFTVNDVTVYPSRNAISREGKEYPLEPRTMSLLCYLILHPGEVCERDELIKAIWGNQFVNRNCITRAISDLRKALGDSAVSPSFIRTIPKRGYEFVGIMNPSNDTKPIKQRPLKTSRSYKPVIYSAITLVLTLASVAVWEALKTPRIEKTITRSVPVIVKDTVGIGIPDSLSIRRIEAKVDAIIDQEIQKK